MRDDIKINDRALALQDQIIEKLEKVFDTDVELDVYNLGLIYEINLDETGLCKIVMTFTDTACDCAESLPIEIVAGLKQIEGIKDIKVEVTWSPAWKITRISRYGRIALGLPPCFEVVDRTDEVSPKHCFEVVDRTDEVSNHTYGKATLT
ncbi:domain of uncharacterised function protein [Streptococcus pneumoniae]|nr:domain of uncharacterised function protein [Streptococcus pneumoniae]